MRIFPFETGATSMPRVREAVSNFDQICREVDLVEPNDRRGLISYLGQWVAKSTRVFSLLSGLLRGPVAKSAGEPRVDQNCLSEETPTFIRGVRQEEILARSEKLWGELAHAPEAREALDAYLNCYAPPWAMRPERYFGHCGDGCPGEAFCKVCAREQKQGATTSPEAREALISNPTTPEIRVLTWNEWLAQ
jgi:hypothetical protein